LNSLVRKTSNCFGVKTAMGTVADWPVSVSIFRGIRTVVFLDSCDTPFMA
jgi:hypothetical protein